MAITYYNRSQGTYFPAGPRCSVVKAHSSYFWAHYGEQCNFCHWIIPGTLQADAA